MRQLVCFLIGGCGGSLIAHGFIIHDWLVIILSAMVIVLDFLYSYLIYKNLSKDVKELKKEIDTLIHGTRLRKNIEDY